MSLKWIVYRGSVALGLLICLRTGNAYNVESETAWVENNELGPTSDYRYLTEIQKTLKKNLIQGLDFALGHQNYDAHALLHNTTDDQYHIIQVLYGLMSEEEIFAKLAIRLASNISEENAISTSDWIKETFQFSDNEAYIASRNFVKWNTVNIPSLNKFMVKFAEYHKILDIIFLNNDFGTMKWLLDNCSWKTKFTIKDTVFFNKPVGLEEDMLSLILMNRKDFGAELDELAVDATFLNFTIQHENFPVLSYMIKKNLTRIEDALINSLKQNKKTLFYTVLQEFITKDILTNVINIPRSVFEYIISNDEVNLLQKIVVSRSSPENIQDLNLNLLFEALYYNASKSFELILKSGININQVLNNTCDSTLLHKATFGRYSYIVEKLIHFGADLYALDCRGMTPLKLAMQNKDLNTFKIMCKNNFNIDFKDSRGDNFLHHAVIDDFKDAVEILLNKGIGVDNRNNAGYTPLFYAVSSNRTDEVIMLLEKGANINLTFSDGETYLHVAVSSDFQDTVNILLEHGVSVDTENKNGDTALSIAIQKESMSVINMILLKYTNLLQTGLKNYLHQAIRLQKYNALRLLLEHKFPINAEDENGFSPLMIATEMDDIHAVKILLDFGANVYKPKNSTSKSLLHYASQWGRSLVIEWLITFVNSVNPIDSDGVTPLHEASYSGHSGIVRALISNGADVNFRSRNTYETPLHLASINGHLDIVHDLLANGAHIDTENKCGETALHIAVKHNQTNTAIELIEKGARIDIASRCDTKQIPLQLTTIQENVIILKQLLKKGSSVSYVDKDGRTALHDASKLGNLLIARELLANGADVGKKTLDDNQCTPLHIAAQYGHLEVLRELLLHGADINDRNKNGWTALHESIENENEVVAIELISMGAAPNAKINEGLTHTPLQMASIKGNINVVHELLKNGASVHPRNSHGWTALHEASKFGHVDIAKELLLKGAAVDDFTHDTNQYTPLHLAVIHGKAKMVEELLTEGANINILNGNGFSALHEAISRNETSIVSLLILKGADFNSKVTRELQYTPLLMAIVEGYVNISMLLIDVRANISATNVRGWTPLHEASKFGYLTLVQKLISEGADVNKKTLTDEQYTPLHLAALNGHVEVVRMLISEGANVNSQNTLGNTPLYLSIDSEHPDVAMILIANGAEDIQSTTSLKYAPLQLAAIKGYLPIVQKLIENGANVSLENDNGWTALHEASKFGHLSIVKELIKHGADVNLTVSLNYISPLQLAAKYGKVDIVKLLISESADVNAVRENGWTALHEAVDNGHFDVASVLIPLVSDVDAKITDRLQYNALLLASINGSLNIVKSLLDNGADIASKNQIGWTALHEASNLGYTSIVKELLMRGIDINQSTDEDPSKTPIQLAATNGQLDVVKILISKGADLDAQTNNGNTALYLSVDNEHPEIAMELISAGANNYHLTNGLKYSPLQVAAIKGFGNVVHALLIKGADISSTNTNGWTALHEASKFGHVSIVKDLLSNGANVNARNIDSWTPLLLAAKWGQLNVAEILISNGADIDAGDENGRTPLYEAIETDHFDIAAVLISRGAKNIPVSNELNNTPLHLATIKGNFETVHELLENGADADVMNSRGWTPLHEASKFGHLRIVQELLSRGANTSISTKEYIQCSVLQIAQSYNHQDICDELISKGADTSLPSQDCFDPPQSFRDLPQSFRVLPQSFRDLPISLRHRIRLLPRI